MSASRPRMYRTCASRGSPSASHRSSLLKMFPECKSASSMSRARTGASASTRSVERSTTTSSRPWSSFSMTTNAARFASQNSLCVLMSGCLCGASAFVAVVRTSSTPPPPVPSPNPWPPRFFARSHASRSARFSRYGASRSTTPIALVRSPWLARSTSSTVGRPLRYVLYTLFVRCERVVLPLPLPPRATSPTPPALNRSGPWRKWMLRPESLFFALAPFFPATTTSAPRRWAARARRAEAAARSRDGRPVNAGVEGAERVISTARDKVRRGG